MPNTVKLEFAGDATSLTKESKRAAEGLDKFGKAATDASDDLGRAGKESQDYLSKVGKLGAGITGLSDAVDNAGGAVQDLADAQSYAKERAMRLARATNDAESAQVDLAQAQRDGAQASLDIGQAHIDAEQAAVDEAKAINDLAKAIKEHGKNSIEAKQAQVDITQAQQDSKQAAEDLKQAQQDANAAVVDAKTYQLDYNEAISEANPTKLQETAGVIGQITPLLSGLIGITGLVTAAQWAWNAAQAASPTTWIIIGIVALIAVIVLIATKTHWFQNAWKWAWGGIKDAAAGVGHWFRDTLWGRWIKGSFDSITGGISRLIAAFRAVNGRIRSALAGVASAFLSPFRSAFNAIARAWNNTIGRLHWSVPGILGFGGFSISAPRLPTFHQGGTVPGPPGAEMLAVVQAGERVSTRTSQVGGGQETPVHVTVQIDRDVLVRAWAVGVRSYGGPIQAAARTR